MVSLQMKNALTIDLEDYYHVSAFSAQMPVADWSSKQSRVERNTDLLLDLLDEGGCKATFFTLGWVAEQQPQVVRRVADRGHEIACHSLRHRNVFEMTKSEFREDTLRAKTLLEDCSSRRVVGYRAPSFSIISKSLWALEVLAELGFTYGAVDELLYELIDNRTQPEKLVQQGFDQDFVHKVIHKIRSSQFKRRGPRTEFFLRLLRLRTLGRLAVFRRLVPSVAAIASV